MIIGIFMLSDNGEVLMQKQFLFSSSICKPDAFSSLLKRNNMELPTSVLLDDLHYFHIFRDKLFLVAATDDNSTSPFVICEYLEKLCAFLRDFLGILSADVVLSNIGLIYEVVCEMTSAGFPKLIDVNKLKPLLSNAVSQPKSESSDILSLLPNNLFGVTEKEKKQMASEASKKPMHVSKSNEDHKNEVYVDLIETLSVIINPNGKLVHCNIIGKLNIKSYLDGNAEVSILFPQDRKEFPKAVFNPSISTKELPKMLKTTAPPGSLDVMAYNVPSLGEEMSLPFTMYANTVPHVDDKLLTLSLKIYCGLPVRHPAVNLVGKIPLPNATVNVTGISSLANVTFARDQRTNEFHFTSPIFPGSSHHTINLKIILSSWTPSIVFELSTVVLKFEVPMLCHSDMKISGLKVQKLNQSSESQPINKWVRYLTYSNSYEFHLKDDWYPV